MGICERRYIFLSICTLQILTMIGRQVFDFLGFLWIPILVNFFEMIFIILGFFGAYQFRLHYLLSYLIWHLVWLAWNLFLICLYLDVGNLNHKENSILKLDPKSESWWRTEGPGCRRNITSEVDLWNVDVANCSLDYVQVEVLQAGTQVFLSILGMIFGLYLNNLSKEKREKSQRKTPKRVSLYSIEFSSQLGDNNDSDNEFDHVASSTSPKPMTPRRVKRRSVMTRGTTSRRSTSSRRQAGARSSARSSRRSVKNPVTKLLEQQHQISHQYDSPASPSTIDSVASIHWSSNGHTNPTYQQSSTQSLNEEFDDIYNNRPASVRSSYSNFHGARTLNYGGTEHYHRSRATVAPQVPQKRSVLQSRPVAFLNSGPPAYTSDTQLAVTIANDSETAI